MMPTKPNNDGDTNTPSRIMVVDDDRLVLATLTRGLKGRGYEVSGFTSGNEALLAYRLDPPDLAMLDMRMPGLSGTETAAGMLAHAHRPILMLSAYDDRAIVHEAVQLGVAGYLIKPIEVNQIVPTIEATLARFAEIAALMANTEKLRDGMEQNRTISTAVGILMERAGLTPDQAFEHLRQLARHQRRGLREVTAEIIQATTLINNAASPRP
jgi:two-component system, response regulator PdtaR